MSAMPSLSSCMPGAPAPEAAWYVLIMTRLMPYFLCMGARAMSAMAVVQLGFATSFLPLVAPMLISGMHSGTSSL